MHISLFHFIGFWQILSTISWNYVRVCLNQIEENKRNSNLDISFDLGLNKHFPPSNPSSSFNLKGKNVNLNINQRKYLN